MTTLKPSSPAAGSRPHVRSHMHGMWEAVAPHWAEHADYTDARHAQNTQRLLDLTRPQPGERVLELASGAGGHRAGRCTAGRTAR